MTRALSCAMASGLLRLPFVWTALPAVAIPIVLTRREAANDDADIGPEAA